MPKHLELTSRQVKDALHGRHPAGGAGGMVGEWTVAEELWGIDLFAWSAWSGAKRVGYEVKVSRSDYRRELLDPKKRRRAVERCHSFYFAVPDGLLTREELAYREPGDLRLDHFQRTPCPGWDVGPVPDDGVTDLFGERRPPSDRRPYAGRCRKFRSHVWYGGETKDRRALSGKHVVRVPVPTVGDVADRSRYDSDEGAAWTPCPVCGGRGYVAKSRVEEEAPTLWVPADVGLIVIQERGGVHTTRVVRQAPISFPRDITQREMAEAFRWVSVRPDKRHTAERERVAALNAIRA